MASASSIELQVYQVFLNEVAHINHIIKNTNSDNHKTNDMNLSRLVETKSYLEERLTLISKKM